MMGSVVGLSVGRRSVSRRDIANSEPDREFILRMGFQHEDRRPREGGTHTPQRFGSINRDEFLGG
jgi:hypothetical protein